MTPSIAGADRVRILAVHQTRDPLRDDALKRILLAHVEAQADEDKKARARSALR
jgi:hypothetical protein